MKTYSILKVFAKVKVLDTCVITVINININIIIILTIILICVLIMLFLERLILIVTEDLFIWFLSGWTTIWRELILFLCLH
jgi:hypothetical protein